MNEKPTYEDLERENASLKRIASALQTTELWLNNIFNSLEEAVFVVTPDRKLSNINDAALRMFGYSIEELADHSTEILHADNEHYLEFGKIIQTAFDPDETANFEFELKRKSGEIFPSEHTVTLLKDRDGERIGFVSIVRDVTQHKREEEALRQSEQKLRMVTETIQDVFWMSTPGVKEMVYISPMYERIWGQDTRQLYESPRSFLEAIHPEDLEKYLTVIDNFHSKGKAYECEYRIVRESGSVRWIQERGYPITDDQGGVFLMTGLCTDITERKQTEEALCTAESKLKLAMRSAGEGLWEWNLKNDEVHFDAVALKMLGYSPKDFTGDLKKGSWWMAQVHPDDQMDMESKFNAFISGIADRYSVEFRLRSKDGSYVYVASDGDILSRDQEGEPEVAIGIHRDITDRKQAEEALEESEKRFRTLVEQSPFGISLIDRDGHYKYLNVKFKQIFGYEPKDIPTGREWFRKAYPEEAYRKEVLSTWKEDQRNIGIGEARPRTYHVVCKDGQKRFIHFRPVTLENGDQLVFHEDVTEAEILEKQLLQAQKVEALSTLTGGIAHDYNNLLAVIIGNLSLIMERVTPGSELADFVNEVNKAALKVSDLTHELMALSRGGAPIKKLGSLKECIKNAAKIVPSDVGIMLEMSLPEDLCPIPHDASKLEAAFRNVVKNAVEAMPDGGPLTIRAENLRVEDGDAVPGLSMNPGDYVRISIQDGGTGISEENLDKLFDPYFSTKPMGTQKGMGLGLATAHAIIKKHGGDITIQSTPDIGTTVSIYLPAQPSNDAAENGTPATLKTQFTIADQKAPIQRILLMDDEEMLRNLAKQMLSRLGYEVETVKDGVEAIEVYRKQLGSDKPFDAVILDLTIKGGVGGEQTLKELFKVDPEIKAVVSSGYFNDPVMADFQDYGFKGAMAKPYSMKDMKEVLGTVL